MNSAAMQKFEAVTKAALKTIPSYDTETGQDLDTSTAEGLILQAADTLLVESAMEGYEDIVKGICMILLHVYNKGSHPGQTSNPLMNKLVDILIQAKANEEKSEQDYSTEDPY